MIKHDDNCEIRDGQGGWVTVGIDEALQRRGEDMRCPECHGHLRPHREYSDGARAHFEHRTRHPGCSTKLRSYTGNPTYHPNALH